jgi:GntR family transcriptional regulator
MCHTVDVTLKVNIRPGQSIFDQVVFAAQKAFISGELAEGQPFPSVRALAADLKIHPNTAHKVVQHLIQERLLEVLPGIGTVVAKAPKARPGDKKRLLQEEVEALVVEAKRVGAGIEEVVEALEARWGELDRPKDKEEQRA